MAGEHDHNHDHEHARVHVRPPAGDRGRWVALHTELREHLPFSVSAVALGLIFAALVSYVVPGSRGAGDVAGGHLAISPLFHVFHPVHMFFSAAATTAMFWRYDRNALKATVIGLVGAIGVCGLSDIGVPQLALMLMGRDAQLHICVIEEPALVIPFAIVGVLVGLGAASGVSRSTLFSHSLHVLASTLASVFYLITPFESLAWISDIGRIFVFVVIAVMVPCCISDIVFPLLMTQDARAAAAQHGH